MDPFGDTSQCIGGWRGERAVGGESGTISFQSFKEGRHQGLSFLVGGHHLVVIPTFQSLA